jgi:acetolactate synthase-1/2/3 large subunit
VTRMSGGEAVVDTLEALGVTHVFGIVSVHNIPIYDAIARRGTMVAVNMRHEQAAVHAADGYARCSGRLGVAITSTGPGAANAAGGLFEAGFASSRVLMITGQVESLFYGRGKGHLHEAEHQLDMLRSLVRRAESVRRTEDIPEAITHVAKDVCTGRPQPGAVEIPIDLQHNVADIVAPIDIGDWPQSTPAEAALERAARLLEGARRPLIWAGGGVISAGAGEELTALAERLGAPVVSSTEGRGAISEDHPLSVGPAPELPAVSELIGQADVVLAVGTRFQQSTTARWTVAIPGKLIHLDADPQSIGRTYEPEVALIGDARLGVLRLLDLTTQPRSDPEWASQARSVRALVEASLRDQIGPDHAAIMDAIQSHLPPDGIVVKDSTMPAYFWGNRLLRVLRPRATLRPVSMAIGPGLPLAIGAAIACNARTLLIQGDGGLMLSLGELATVVENRLPLVICLFNDRGYGIIRWMQDQLFAGRRIGVDLTTPDFVALARSFGMAATAVARAEEFSPALEEAMRSDGPTLIDIDAGNLRPVEVRPTQPTGRN